MLLPKDRDWLNKYQNKACKTAAYKRLTSDLDTYGLTVSGWKKVFHATGN